MGAACSGHLEVVRVLLEWDADKNLQCNASADCMFIPLLLFSECV